jgi:hypothetical protein
VTRRVDNLLADLAEAGELVRLGKDRWDSERPLRLAGEAVIGRLGTLTRRPELRMRGRPVLFQPRKPPAGGYKHQRMRGA